MTRFVPNEKLDTCLQSTVSAVVILDHEALGSFRKNRGESQFTPATRPAGEVSTNFSYDYEGWVTQITRSGMTTNSNSYNGIGARIAKTDSGGAFSYMRNGTGVTAPVLSDGAANYTPGISERRAGATKHQSADIKNATQQLNISQTISASKQYDAFGNVTSQSGTFTGPFLYGGKFGYQSDSDTGYQLLGHRYYNSSTGRFLARDPSKAGRNWYVYCDANPLAFADPTGLDKFIFNGHYLKYFGNDGTEYFRFEAYSGVPGACSLDEGKKDFGPIPHGRYAAFPADVQMYEANPLKAYFEDDKFSGSNASWGNWRVPLRPLPGTETFGRDGMFLHGGQQIGSLGCIDVGPNDEVVIGILIKHSPRFLELDVVYPSSGGGTRVPGSEGNPLAWNCVGQFWIRPVQ